MANQPYDPDSDEQRSPYRRPGPDNAQAEDQGALQAAEQRGAEGGASGSDDDRLGKGYTENDKRRNLFSRQGLRRLASRRNLLLIGVPSGIVGIFLLLLLLIAGSLKLPQIAQNIEDYEFAQVSQRFAQNAGSVTDEELALEAAPDGTWSTLKAKFTQGYSDVRDSTWGRLDVYRPNQVMKTLTEQKDLSFHYRASAIRGRSILTSISFDGVDYPVQQVGRVARWVPGLNSFLETRNATNTLAKSALLDEINKFMRAKEISTVIRGQVDNRIIQAAGGSRVGWILSKFKDLKNPQDMQDEASVQMYEATEAGDTTPNSATTEEVKQASADAKAATDQEVSSWSPGNPNNSALPQTVSTGNDEAALAAANNDLNPSLLKSALGVADPVYNVFVPLCIAYDGSVQQSQPSTDNQTNQQQNAFDQLAAEADQQKEGDQTPTDTGALANAITGTNAELGNGLTQSIPYRRAAGLPVDTSTIPSAEAGSSGSFSYSLYDTIGLSGSSAGGKAAQWITGNLCSSLTSTYTAGALAVANIVAAVLSFGGTEAGEQAAGQGATTFAKTFVTDTVRNIFAKQVVQKGANDTIERGFLNRAMRFVFKQGVIVGGTYGLAELAHMEVAAQAGQANNGLAQNNDLASEADSGANIESGKLNQQLTFARPLDANEVSTSDQQTQHYVSDRNAEKSFTQRYFATSNANSLVSHMAIDLNAEVHTGILSAMAKLISSLLVQPLSYLGSLLRLSGVAQATPASDTQHYGNVQFGWTAAEVKLENSDNSYKALENQNILDSYKGAEAQIASKYAVCFGYKYNAGGNGDFDPTDPNGDLQFDSSDTLGSLLSKGLITRDSSGNVTNDGLCSPKNLSYNSPDPLANDPNSPNGQFNDLIFRWRLAEGFDATLDQLISEQGVSS